MTYTVYQHGSYNYYGIEGKQIISIAFFNEKGVVMDTGHQGWLELNRPYSPGIRRLELDKAPIRKMGADFAAMYALKQPFYAKGSVTQHSITETGYILYLPYLPDEWIVTTEYVDHATTKSEFTRYVHKTKEYRVNVFVKSIPIDANVEFVRKVREIAELFVYNKNNISDISIIEKREKIVELIKKFPAGGSGD